MAKITKDTIVADLLTIAPGAAPLLHDMGMHCLGCAMAKSETLGQACAGHGVDVNELLVEINALVDAR